MESKAVEASHCYLCREEIPLPAVAHCIHCNRPICTKHNAENLGKAECGPCAAREHGLAQQGLFGLK
jgi:hypothetical protein